MTDRPESIDIINYKHFWQDELTEGDRRHIKIQYFVCPDCDGELTERVSGDSECPVAVGCECGFSILTNLSPANAAPIREGRIARHLSCPFPLW